jgi:hypothetical protein
MEIHYELTQDDLAIGDAACASIYQKAAPQPLLARVTLYAIVALCVIVVSASLGMYRSYSGRVTYDFSFVFFPLVLAFISFVFYLKVCKRFYAARRNDAIGPFPIKTKLSLGQAHLELESKHGHCRYVWSAVSGVRVQGAHTLVLIRPWAVIPIPQSAFGSVQERDAFVALLNSRVGA